MPVKVRDVIKRLEQAGWRHVRRSGDHRVFRNPMVELPSYQESWETMFGQERIVQF